MPATPQETLADERRRRIPAAVAAIGAGILTLIGSIVVLFAGDFPAVQLLRALDERLSAGAEPVLKVREMLYFNDHPFLEVGPVPIQQIGAAFISAVTAAAVGYALVYLYRATYARRPEIGRATIVVIVAGSVLVAIPSLVGGVAVALELKSFADSSDQTAQAARDVLGSPAIVACLLLKQFGGLLLGLAFVLLSLKAMSVGLLTRFMGVLGIIVGVITILPLGRSIPFVQMLWLIALGMLFLHRWSGAQGLPPAWTTGEEQPWPSQQELREARLARGEEKAAARGERKEKPSGGSSNGKARGRPAVPETPAPEAPKRPAHSSSKKKKRKRR